MKWLMDDVHVQLIQKIKEMNFLLHFGLTSRQMFRIWHSFSHFMRYISDGFIKEKVFFFASQYQVIQQDNASLICFLRLQAAMASTGKNAQQFVVMVQRL
jgi:hypothetical protein